MRYIVLGLLFYFLYKYFKYITRSMVKPAAPKKENQQDINANINPGRSGKQIKDGEYIEFEEVK